MHQNNQTNPRSSNNTSATGTSSNNTAQNNIFQNNPAFAGLTPEKMQFLSNFANAKKPTQMQEMIPFLMASMNQAKKDNIQFSANESDLLIDLLKQNLPPEEAKKADMIIRLMKKRSQ